MSRVCVQSMLYFSLKTFSYMHSYGYDVSCLRYSVLLYRFQSVIQTVNGIIAEIKLKCCRRNCVLRNCAVIKVQKCIVRIILVSR